MFEILSDRLRVVNGHIVDSQLSSSHAGPNRWFARCGEQLTGALPADQRREQFELTCVKCASLTRLYTSSTTPHISEVGKPEPTEPPVEPQTNGEAVADAVEPQTTGEAAPEIVEELPAKETPSKRKPGGRSLGRSR